jgi:hypothetical protein
MARQAPKPPDDDPAVVDLARYKRARAAQKQAKAKPKPGPSRSGEPLLGSRPRAGLILALMALAMLALWLASSLR